MALLFLWLCYFCDFSVGLTTVQDHFIPNYIFICSYIFIPITQGSHQTGTGLQRVQQLVPIPIPSCTHTVYPARFPDLCHSLSIFGCCVNCANLLTVYAISGHVPTSKCCKGNCSWHSVQGLAKGS